MRYWFRGVGRGPRPHPPVAPTRTTLAQESGAPLGLVWHAACHIPGGGIAMDMKCLISTLARQIDAAKLHAGFERGLAKGDPSPAESILRSLRTTYSALSTGL